MKNFETVEWMVIDEMNTCNKAIEQKDEDKITRCFYKLLGMKSVLQFMDETKKVKDLVVKLENCINEACK